MSMSWLAFSSIRAEWTAWIWILPASLERWARYQREEGKFSGIFQLHYGIIRSAKIPVFPWVPKGTDKLRTGQETPVLSKLSQESTRDFTTSSSEGNRVRAHCASALTGPPEDYTAASKWTSLRAEFQGLGKNTYLQAHHRGEWDKAQCFSHVLTENISSYKQWQAVVKWQICHEYQMSDWKGVKQPWHQL